MQKIRHNATLGKNIRSFRRAAKLTQEQVIAKMQLENCAISRSTYAKIEAGLANIRAREVVTRVLKYLQQEGMIALFRGGVQILQPQALEDLAADSLR